MHGVIKLWDVTTGKEIRTLNGPSSSLTLSPDGTRLAGAGNLSLSLSQRYAGWLHLWDLRTGEAICTEQLHKGPGATLASFTPDGRFLVTGGSDMLLHVLDGRTGKHLRTLEGHRDEVSSLTTLPDGRGAVSGDLGGELRMWCLETGELLWTIDTGGWQVFALGALADGRSLLSAGRKGALQVWDIREGELEHEVRGIPGSIESLSTNGDASLVATGSSGVRLWDLRADDGGRRAGAQQIFDLAIARNGSQAVAGCEDGTLRTWSWPDASEQRSFAIHDSWINTVSVLRGGRQVLTTSGDGLIKLVDVVDGVELAALRGHEASVNALAIAANRPRAISVSDDGRVIVWDVAMRSIELNLEGHEDYIWSVAVSADGAIAATGCADKSIFVWDLERGRRSRRLEGHKNAVSCLAMTPDGRRLVSGSFGGEIKLWDLSTGTEVSRFETLRRMADHDDYAKTETLTALHGLALLADGEHFLTASDDCAVRLWSLRSPVPKAAFVGDSVMLSCATSPHSDHAAAGDRMGRLHALSLSGLGQSRRIRR